MIMNYSLLFHPVSLESLDLQEPLSSQQLASSVLLFNPDAPVNIGEAQMAIV